MRSDGTYTFRGHLRATGFPSFAYKVQVAIRCSTGVVIVVEASGRVFGTDTPGAPGFRFLVKELLAAIDMGAEPINERKEY